MEFEDDCDGVRISREYYELPELVSVGVNVLLSLEVSIRLECHKHDDGLMLWAEY